jgi:hypothetical protein
VVQRQQTTSAPTAVVRQKKRKKRRAMAPLSAPHPPVPVRESVTASTTPDTPPPPPPSSAAVPHQTTSSVPHASKKDLPPRIEDDNGPPVLSVTAGDLADCVSSTEIDALLGHVPGYIPAGEYYAFKSGRTDGDSLLDSIRRHVAEHGLAVFAVHVRNHWATAIVRPGSRARNATVYDVCSPVCSPGHIK